MGGEFRTWAGGLRTEPDSNALQWVMHDSLVIVVQRTDSPPTANWRRFIEHLQRSRVGRFLLFMLGNARLSATQRSDLVAHFKAHAQRVAVIAESDASRGTATALGWFFPNLKVFAPDELEGRPPRPDDFIVADPRNMESRTQSQATKAHRRDAELIGVPNKGSHALRRFMISAARSSGAREWPALCEAVSCLKVDPDRLPGRIYDISYDICVSENANARQSLRLFGGGGGNRTGCRSPGFDASSGVFTDRRCGVVR